MFLLLELNNTLAKFIQSMLLQTCHCHVSSVFAGIWRHLQQCPHASFSHSSRGELYTLLPALAPGYKRFRQHNATCWERLIVSPRLLPGFHLWCEGEKWHSVWGHIQDSELTGKSLFLLNFLWINWKFPPLAHYVHKCGIDSQASN